MIYYIIVFYIISYLIISCHSILCFIVLYYIIGLDQCGALIGSPGGAGMKGECESILLHYKLLYHII